MATAINLLARGYRFEVSADATTWLRVTGMNDLNPGVNPTEVDSSDYDSNGWSASEITMQSWKVSIKAHRKATGGVEDPAFSLIRSCVGQFGDAARLYCRWYRTDGINEAWQGRAIVGMSPSKTGVADLNEWQIDFDGDGVLSAIANPYNPNVAPVVISATPSGVAAGGQVTITGQNFTGTLATAGVKFGGVTSATYTVMGDSTIVAVMPAGSAGSAVVTVINANGTSNALPYTRG